MIRYAITDGSRFGSDASARLAGLVADAARWADLGLDFVQLREKTLGAGELFAIAVAMVRVLGETKLLVSGRVDVAVAAGASGVHLTSSVDELTVSQVKQVMPEAVVSASCHSVAEVTRAREGGVDLILFGPVFGKFVGGKLIVAGVGLEALQTACKTARGVKVLALGGVDDENAVDCVEAGAAGVAGIWLFQ